MKLSTKINIDDGKYQLSSIDYIVKFEENEDIAVIVKISNN